MIATKEIPRAAADLETLQSSLRELQRPYSEKFWPFEKLISRIDDELDRRAS